MGNLGDLLCGPISVRGAEEVFECAFGEPGSACGVLEIVENVGGAVYEMFRGEVLLAGVGWEV